MKTVEEKLEFINRTCNTDYKSMEEVDWDYISKYQILSEDFMYKFENELNWILIPAYQNYSDEFAKNFRFRIDNGYSGSLSIDEPEKTEYLPESNTEFNININKPKKIILTEPSPYDGSIILTEPTEPLEEDPLQLKTRKIKSYENELLEVLKNPQLPTLITNIQDLELLLQKIDKQINENNFYHIEIKWTGDGITDGESNNDIFDLETGIFTEKELKEYMQYLHSFYEKKLNKLKYQYLNIFNGVKYRNLITE